MNLNKISTDALQELIRRTEERNQPVLQKIREVDPQIKRLKEQLSKPMTQDKRERISKKLNALDLDACKVTLPANAAFVNELVEFFACSVGIEAGNFCRKVRERVDIPGTTARDGLYKITIEYWDLADPRRPHTEDSQLYELGDVWRFVEIIDATSNVYAYERAFDSFMDVRGCCVDLQKFLRRVEAHLKISPSEECTVPDVVVTSDRRIVIGGQNVRNRNDEPVDRPPDHIVNGTAFMIRKRKESSGYFTAEDLYREMGKKFTKGKSVPRHYYKVYPKIAELIKPFTPSGGFHTGGRFLFDIDPERSRVDFLPPVD